MTTRYWFKPKRYGLGATPVTWEGWAFTAVVAAALIGASWYLLAGHAAPSAMAVAAWAVVFVVVLSAAIAVSVSKTEGAWRWRWGGRE